MLKRVLLALLLVAAAIQVVRPAKNRTSQPPGPDDFVVRFKPPAEIAQVLRTACYDCHSDNTRYPWYAEVQPASWWLASHIREGKKELNFSRFGAYDRKTQAKKLNQISEEVFEEKMPLPSYTWLHSEARLSAAQITAVTAWVDDLRDRLPE